MNQTSTIELQPTLVGKSITLRPLRVDDLEALHQAASDPLIWEQHPEPTRYLRPVFEEGFFAGALSSGSAFVVVDNASDAIIGSTRYYDWNPAADEIAIGFTFLMREYWGGATNREMKRLLLDHIFQWAKVVWFHVGINNRRSRRAMEKLGANLSHIQGMVIQGKEHLHAVYRIDAER